MSDVQPDPPKSEEVNNSATVSHKFGCKKCKNQNHKFSLVCTCVCCYFSYTHIYNRILCDDALVESVRHLTILCQIMQNYDRKMGTKNGGHYDAVDAFRIFMAFLEFTH